MPREWAGRLNQAPASPKNVGHNETSLTMKRLVTLGLVCAAIGLGGCAPQRQQASLNSHGKEYFPEGIYGRASPRVVAEGEEVPKGGGQYLVGKAYSVAGHTYVPSERKYAGVGAASWYGDAFHGRRTANGEIYDKNAVTAAHPTMPLPSYARVTNLRNRRSIIVRVNDRGPYHGGRIMDLSSRAAEALDYRHIGTARVKVEYVGKAAIGGSDDNKLMATLRVDGQPAQLDDFALSPTLVAERGEPAPKPTPSEAARDIERVAMIQPDSLPEAREPAPPPSGRQVALAEPLTPEELGPMADLPAHPPLPPQRPLDLGTIPGADTPIHVSRR
jgi:rare lipoprotein A